MLVDIGLGTKIFLQAEPTNAYDKNAYRVLVWKNDRLNHVGYVQRHFAAKIEAGLRSQDMKFSFGEPTTVVAKLKNDSTNPNTFEAEIIGVIVDVKGLIKREEAIRSDTGIFGKPKKGATGLISKEEAKVKQEHTDTDQAGRKAKYYSWRDAEDWNYIVSDFDDINDELFKENKYGI